MICDILIQNLINKYNHAHAYFKTIFGPIRRTRMAYERLGHEISLS